MLGIGLRYLFLVSSLLTYAVLAPFGYVAFAIFALLKVGTPESRARVLQAIIQNAFGLLHGWLRFTRLLDWVRPVDFGVAPRSYVIVANHPSLTDTTAIMACTPQVCAVVRSDLFSRPLLRPLFEAAGYIDAGGRGVQAVARWIESAKARLEKGFSVLIFPEGTRSPPHGIHAMGRVAFELSCQSNVPLLALLITEDPCWLGKGQGFFRLPKRVPLKQIRVLGIFNPQEFQGDSRSMREAVQARFRANLLPPPGKESTHLEPGSGVDLPRTTG